MSDETPTPAPQADPEPVEQGEVVEDPKPEPAPAAEVAVREQVLNVSPTTPMAEWNVMLAQAETLAKSDIVPTAYRRKPANIVAAALTGRAYGWDVMAAMRNGHVIEGTYAIRPEAQLGMIRSAGHKVMGEVTGDGITCAAKVTGTRCDDGTSMTVTYTFAQAVRAGLVSIKEGEPWARSSTNKPLPWEQNPEDMVWVRAVSRLSRRHFSDVTLGLSWIADELTGGAFYEDESGEAAVAKLEDELPTGWESWEECNNAHDSYIERWRSAPQAAREAITAFTKEHEGYQRPMVRAKLNALDAKLTQEIERAPADAPQDGAENVDDGSGLSPGGTTPSGQAEGEVSAETPPADPATVADQASAAPPDGDGIEDAELVEEPAAPQPPASGSSASTPEAGTADASAAPPAPAEAPASGPSDGDGTPTAPEPSEPAAAVAPGPAPGPAAAAPDPGELSSGGERQRLAVLLKESFADPADTLARGALCAIVSNGRTRSSKELTGVEIKWAIKAGRLFRTGNLLFGTDNPGEVVVCLAAWTPPGADDVPTLIGADPEGGENAEVGDEFVGALGAFLYPEV